MKKFISQLLKGALLGLFVASPLTFNTAKADDTEVYFFDGAKLEIGRPKVMLLLEYSAAMNGGGRLQKIKDALAMIAKNEEVSSQVDFGLAIFAMNKTGSVKEEGSIIYPISPFNSATNSPTYFEQVDYLGKQPAQPGKTPTLEGMSEAYRYFLGRSPYFWKGELPSGATHPDAVTAEPRYDYDHLTATCAAQALVVLAHGQVNGPDLINSTESITGVSGASDTDMVSFVEREGIKTYTISPGSSGNNKANLDAWASAGGTGQAFDWNDEATCDPNVDDGNLCSILAQVFEEVAEQSTSFVQAGVTVSQQNRLNHDNHLYFAQFQADNIARWPGNLKKYKIGGGELVDVNEKPAVDPFTGLFLEERDADGFITGGTSFWPRKDDAGNILVHDGNQVTLGGTLEYISDFLFPASFTAADGSVWPVFNEDAKYTRNIYTDKQGTNNTGVLFPLADAPDSMFEMDGTENLSLKEVKALTLGYRLRDVSVTYFDDFGKELTQVIQDVVEPARLMGDPLHSVPKVVQYGNGQSLVFVGTNLGYLHAVDLANGNEQWAYVPSVMLSEMKDFMDDVEIGGDATLHNYGLDGEIHIAHADTNNNLKVDDDEKALLFIGMRRGGNHYFVLDISNPTEPKYLFKITGGSTTKLAKLSDTWSGITVANIDYAGATKTVAIFGGGYDYDQDTAGTAFVADDTGNDIFIYDIAGKSVLWHLHGDTGSNSDNPQNQINDVKLKMNSVPANIRGISLDNNSTIDHLYVADVGGQIFRFDLYDTADGMEVRAGRIFNANGGDAANNRRFYYAPSVAYIPRPNNRSFMAVAIGSGYRAHPLDTVIDDYFFMVKDTGILESPKTFKDIPFDPSGNGALVDVTQHVKSNTETTQAVLSDDKGGWFIKLNGDITTYDANGNPVVDTYEGEKVIAEPRILFGRVVFTSYVPTIDTTKLQCSPVIGSAKLYGVEVLDGSSFFDDNTRTIDLVSEGLPPIFQLLYTSGANASDDDAAFIGLVGNEVIDDAFTEALTTGYDGVIRVNWRKKPDDE